MATRTILKRRRLGILALGVVSLAWSLVSGCSSDGNRDRNDSSNGGSGNNTGGLNGQGASLITGDDDDDNQRPDLQSCDKNTPCPDDHLCVAQGADSGLCAPKGNPCSSDQECQNDTYCCGKDCRLDGVDEGICVTGDTRPTNPECTSGIAIGVFAPDLHCKWPQGPLSGDYANHIQVLPTPLVANLPNDSGTAAEIVIVTSDREKGDTGGGRIRILNGQTCEEVELITAGPDVRDAAAPAIGDLNGDGNAEIVARVNHPDNDKLVAFEWNGSSYGVMWTSTGSNPGDWDGVSIHDLDNDGKPEVIGRSGAVYNGQTGHQITAGGGAVILDSEPTIADVDGDGKAELIANKVFTWSGTSWTEKYPGPNISSTSQRIAFYAVADFGTRVSAGNFDHKKKDGVPEVVAVGPVGGDEQTGTVRIYTLQGEEVMKVDFPARGSCPTGSASGERGGPPTIGDFDGDGMPELANAGAFEYRVFDLDCKDPGQNCHDPSRYIRWQSETQDCSSGVTSSTIFDFEGDGRAEVVYGDECFLRVYDGLTGEVLFSTPRASATWGEQPIVADPDNSDRSKIIYGGATTFSAYGNCPQGAFEREGANLHGRWGWIDAHYAGIRCRDDGDCISESCVEGFCRCDTDKDCGNDWEYDDTNPNRVLSGLVCYEPKPGTPGSGNVCRAQHGKIGNAPAANEYFSGVRVYRDKLDRWASSRPLWNQQAYAITHINDDLSIPKTSSWEQNFTSADLNNFRQNRQGATSAELADITGALESSNACLVGGGNVTFTGRVCNRGLRGVGANMPASFYLGDTSPENLVCKTTTDGPVPVGGCASISCQAKDAEVPSNATIIMVVNDAGGGQRLVDECNYDNNTSSIVLERCVIR